MPTTRTATPAHRASRAGRHLRHAALVAAVAAVLTACGGGGTSEPAAAPSTTAVVAAAAPVADAAPGRAEPTTTLVARPTVDTAVHAEPGGAPSMTLPATTEFGSPLALVVLDQGDGWLQVALPTRPNGSTGFIAADGVELREVDVAVHVSLTDHRLTVTDGDAVVLETAIATGSPDTPTPTGTFYVTDKLDTGDPNGAYGPFAFGLSAHSDVLTEFAGGDGQVGIHGTADPSSIGNPVSNGCVRVPNDVAVALNDLLPLGTPVVIG